MVCSTNQLSTDHLEVIARNVSHELRTSLLAIKSGISGVKDYIPLLVTAYEMAVKEGLDVPEIQPKYLDMLTKALDFAERAANCSTTYVNMFATNLMKLEADKLVLESCSIKECLQEAVKQFPYKSDAQKLLLINSVKLDTDFLFMGNKSLVTNLLLNLLKNAIYHVQDAGKGEIQVWTKTNFDKNYIYIKDTAKGISENELAFIFYPFYKTQKHNIGMGLYFCKELMRALKGDISCSSREGSFVEFVVTFPALATNNN